MSNVVAIHQPNFYPWLGFFNKWARADVFILLDDVQFPKKGGVWTNRCRILRCGDPVWFTAPIDRSFHGLRTIREVDLVGDRLWRARLLRKFGDAYRNAPMINDALELLEADLLGTQSALLELNMDALLRLGSVLGLDQQKIVLSSSISVASTATERLASLVQQVNGDVYLVGAGASGYQRDEVFAAAGIQLLHQDFTPHRYLQQGADSFVPGLSILDAVSFVGIDGARGLVY